MLTYPIKTKRGKEKKIHIKTGRETTSNGHEKMQEEAIVRKNQPEKDTRMRKKTP